MALCCWADQVPCLRPIFIYLLYTLKRWTRQAIGSLNSSTNHKEIGTIFLVNDFIFKTKGKKNCFILVVGLKISPLSFFKI